MINKSALIKGLLALTALLLPAAFAQVDKAVTATVTSENTLTNGTGDAAISFALTGFGTTTDANTVLDYSSNDGLSHALVVEVVEDGITGDVWTFTAEGAGTTDAYPVLSFESASVTGDGTGSTTAGDLNLSDNTVGAITTVDVVTAILNGSGTATVTLGLDVGQGVGAGTYTSTVRFALVQK